MAVRASVCPKIWERHFATHSSQINNKHLQCLSTRKFTRSGPFSLVLGQILARRSEGIFQNLRFVGIQRIDEVIVGVGRRPVVEG